VGTAAAAAHRDLCLLAQKLVFHKSNLSTCEPATKMEGFCLCFVRLSHTQPKQPLAALTVYDIHVT
jgi:hypothetical protein